MRIIKIFNNPPHRNIQPLLLRLAGLVQSQLDYFSRWLCPVMELDLGLEIFSHLAFLRELRRYVLCLWLELLRDLGLCCRHAVGLYYALLGLHRGELRLLVIFFIMHELNEEKLLHLKLLLLLLTSLRLLLLFVRRKPSFKFSSRSKFVDLCLYLLL